MSKDTTARKSSSTSDCTSINNDTLSTSSVNTFRGGSWGSLAEADGSELSFYDTVSFDSSGSIISSAVTDATSLPHSSYPDISNKNTLRHSAAQERLSDNTIKVDELSNAHNDQFAGPYSVSPDSPPDNVHQIFNVSQQHEQYRRTSNHYSNRKSVSTQRCSFCKDPQSCLNTECGHISGICSNEAAWFVCEVSVADLITGSVFSFPCYDWLAVTGENVSVHKEINLDKPTTFFQVMNYDMRPSFWLL